MLTLALRVLLLDAVSVVILVMQNMQERNMQPKTKQEKNKRTK